MLYLKCVVAGLLALILVFGLIFLAEVVAVEMIGFGIVFASPVSWLVFALAVFGAGFLRERRRLTESAPRNKWDGRNRKGRRDSPPLSVEECQKIDARIFPSNFLRQE